LGEGAGTEQRKREQANGGPRKRFDRHENYPRVEFLVVANLPSGEGNDGRRSFRSVTAKILFARLYCVA
jgi:hypothetical protein